MEVRPLFLSACWNWFQGLDSFHPFGRPLEFSSLPALPMLPLQSAPKSPSCKATALEDATGSPAACMPDCLDTLCDWRSQDRTIAHSSITSAQARSWCHTLACSCTARARWCPFLQRRNSHRAAAPLIGARLSWHSFRSRHCRTRRFFYCCGSSSEITTTSSFFS